jgi:hypothetical protein
VRRRKLSTEEKKERNRRYYEAHKDKIAERMHNWRIANKDDIAKRQKQWYQEQGFQYYRLKYKDDIGWRLAHTLRSRLNCAIKNNQKVGSAIEELGCSIEDLKKHLESQFQPGMTWDNWSKDGWHIDHILPLDSFDLSDHTQLKMVCNYQNLRPLWAKDNLSKGNKV